MADVRAESLGETAAWSDGQRDRQRRTTSRIKTVEESCTPQPQGRPAGHRLPRNKASPLYPDALLDRVLTRRWDVQPVG